MNVLHLSTTDRGGAAGAARRIHLALRGQGVESRLLVGIPSREPEPQLDIGQVGGAGASAWNALWPRIQGAALRAAGLKPGHPFSPALPGIGGIERHPWVSWSDVVCLYWVAGLVPPAALAPIGRPIVWRLSDEWAYTGGCHYAGDCDGFLAGCRICPAFGEGTSGTVLGSWLSRRGFAARQEGYRRAPLAIVAPSRWIAARAAASPLLAGTRIHQVYTGVDTTVFRPDGRDETRRGLGFQPDDVVVVFGGTDPRKGLPALRNALGLAAQGPAGPRFKALIVGSDQPPELPVPTQAVGFVADETRLAGFYAAGDVVAVPSTADNLPQVALEAMACGTPVVGFDAGGTAEAIRHGVTGFVAPPGDVAGLAEGLAWAAAAAEDGTARREARAWAEKRFDLVKQAAAFAQVLEAERETWLRSGGGEARS